MEIEEVPLWALVEAQFGGMDDFVELLVLGHSEVSTDGVVGGVMVMHPQREDHLTWIGGWEWDDGEDDG